MKMSKKLGWRIKRSMLNYSWSLTTIVRRAEKIFEILTVHVATVNIGLTNYEAWQLIFLMQCHLPWVGSCPCLFWFFLINYWLILNNIPKWIMGIAILNLVSWHNDASFTNSILSLFTDTLSIFLILISF